MEPDEDVNAQVYISGVCVLFLVWVWAIVKIWESSNVQKFYCFHSWRPRLITSNSVGVVCWTEFVCVCVLRIQPLCGSLSINIVLFISLTFFFQFLFFIRQCVPVGCRCAQRLTLWTYINELCARCRLSFFRVSFSFFFHFLIYPMNICPHDIDQTRSVAYDIQCYGWMENIINNIFVWSPVYFDQISKNSIDVNTLVHQSTILTRFENEKKSPIDSTKNGIPYPEG